MLTDKLERATNGVHDPERALLRDLAIAAIAKLTPRQQAVVTLRMHGATYREIGRKLGLSFQRAHQVGEEGLGRLRELLGLE